MGCLLREHTATSAPNGVVGLCACVLNNGVEDLHQAVDGWVTRPKDCY